MTELKETKELKFIKNMYFVTGIFTFLAVFSVLIFSFFREQIIMNSEKIEKLKTEINAVETALQKYHEERGYYPSPDDSVGIVAWKGNFVQFQWNVWESLIKKLELTDNYKGKYTYTITSKGDRYQLGYFINNNKIISKGARIGIFTDSNWVPLQNSKKTISDLLDWNETVTVHFDENMKKTGDSDILTSLKSVVNYYEYDPSLIGYWDMETLTRDWKLFDLSWNRNHWILNGDIKVWDVNWTIWKATAFDWEDDFINLDVFSRVLKDQDEFTVSYAFKSTAEIKKYITVLGLNWDEVDNILRLGHGPKNGLFFSFSEGKNRFEIKKGLVDWNWHNIAFTYSKKSNVFKIYVDWVDIKKYYKPKETERNFDVLTKMSIGQDYDIDEKTLESKKSDFFTWEFDELLVYARVLSPEEIIEIHKK